MNKRSVLSTVLALAAILLIVLLSVGFGYILHDRIAKTSDIAVPVNEMKEIIERYFYFYDDDASEETLLSGAFNGMVASMNDPYARYYSAEEFDAEMESDAGDYVGIGISVGAPDEVGSIVYSVYTGSSADLAGMRVSDVIIEVNGHPSANTAMDTFMDYFSKDDAVPDEITVLRDGQTLHFTLTRSAVHIQRVNFQMLDEETGYLQLTEFLGSAGDDFSNAMHALSAQGAKNVIIDLRGNLGGNLDVVLRVADCIIPKGQVVVTIKSRFDDADVYTSNGSESFDCRYVVLVDGDTASASELLAGAMQDYGIATIVGTKTFGKGIVQSYYRVNSTSGWLKLTTDAYYTPNDVCIHGIGIVPDIVIEQAQAFSDAPVEMIPHDRDVQLQAALTYLKQSQQTMIPAA